MILIYSKQLLYAFFSMMSHLHYTLYDIETQTITQTATMGGFPILTEMLKTINGVNCVVFNGPTKERREGYSIRPNDPLYESKKGGKPRSRAANRSTYYKATTVFGAIACRLCNNGIRKFVHLFPGFLRPAQCYLRVRFPSSLPLYRFRRHA